MKTERSHAEHELLRCIYILQITQPSLFPARLNVNNNNQTEGANCPQLITDSAVTTASKQPLTPKVILRKLLGYITPINFHMEAFERPGSKVTLNSKDNKLREKHFLVIIVDKLIELAEKNNWG